MLAMLLAVLYKLEGLKTEILKQDLVHLLYDSSESATVYFFYGSHRQVEQ